MCVYSWNTNWITLNRARTGNTAEVVAAVASIRASMTTTRAVTEDPTTMAMGTCVQNIALYSMHIQYNIVNTL